MTPHGIQPQVLADSDADAEAEAAEAWNERRPWDEENEESEEADEDNAPCRFCAIRPYTCLCADCHLRLCPDCVEADTGRCPPCGDHQINELQQEGYPHWPVMPVPRRHARRCWPVTPRTTPPGIQPHTPVVMPRTPPAFDMSSWIGAYHDCVQWTPEDDAAFTVTIMPSNIAKYLDGTTNNEVTMHSGKGCFGSLPSPQTGHLHDHTMTAFGGLTGFRFPNGSIGWSNACFWQKKTDADRHTRQPTGNPAPGTPDAPVMPGTPVTPVMPGTPDAPVMPGTPVAPVMPGTPDTDS
jgi:hypothetical protein